ncbi:TIGR03364 family FAD-dependent oxidoreductase [Nonomuraea gerenzanensis]|uniref:Putative secreted oxidoreductase n=1 Tax=Nonomuraea gerenzanensis TaxID=93944 RepID=A0A1M4EI43_9ACTN|nr:TIGR03364 family FAD-dependent oxidoreductase [Nonomuraea gerenzanensis]UBU10243.1 TIGR03364 family FAD-dependent oxidoreductase [Nonomuraea gerenzanensis]SBO98621.1 putative secreted oxidoreductase [Nonomuraea gerenzanensis]
MTSHLPWDTSLDAADLVVVGAGIVGLAHAVDAVARGLSVVVVERDERAVGASVRNFGHGCFTAQDGRALRYAMAARTAWLRLAKEAGLWLDESGTVVVARADDEYAVLSEFAAARDGQAVLLDARQVAGRIPVGPGVVGGAWLPLDVRVDPRQAVHAIAAWLAGQGVRFHWATSAHLVEPGLVTTSRGRIRAGHVVMAVGHDVDRHFPALAESAGLRRCVLRMLRVADPHGRRVDPAVLSGFSLLRYGGFAACPSEPALRARLESERPELTGIGLNLMFTQRPDGDLVVGDTHAYAVTPEPFGDDELDRHVLAESARLLGTGRLTVRERWRGVYASAPEPFLVAAPMPGVRVVSVTSGIGMTTALGLAPEVLDDLLA